MAVDQMTYAKYKDEIVNKKYSSFAQTKGLLWKEWFEGILNDDFLPPVGAVIDLTDACNFSCYWCNAQSFRSGDYLETNHVKKCVDFLADWDVKSICLAGGGEPSLHPDFGDIIEYIHRKGPEVGISTNGLKLDRRTKRQIADCGRFCGFSIDAGNKNTWSQLKGSSKSQWKNILENAREISDYETDLDLTFKMMLVPENQYQIEDACKVAKKTGFDSFFVRPAAFEGMRDVEKSGSFDVECIHEQFEKCLEYEDDQFLVYKSFGRVDQKFEKGLQFEKCRASPLIAVLCADGYCYLCIDRREDERVKMCKHLKLREFWNSEKHHEMIESIDYSECPRCAFSHYNQQIAAYKNDYMFRWFP